MQPIRPGARRARGGDADYPRAGPPPAPATFRPKLSAAWGRRETPPARPVGVRLRLCHGSNRQWESGALRGAATETLKAEDGEGTRGHGTREGRRRSPLYRVSWERKKESDSVTS